MTSNVLNNKKIDIIEEMELALSEGGRTLMISGSWYDGPQIQMSLIYYNPEEEVQKGVRYLSGESIDSVFRQALEDMDKHDPR